MVQNWNFNLEFQFEFLSISPIIIYINNYHFSNQIFQILLLVHIVSNNQGQCQEFV